MPPNEWLTSAAGREWCTLSFSQARRCCLFPPNFTAHALVFQSHDNRPGTENLCREIYESWIICQLVITLYCSLLNAYFIKCFYLHTYALDLFTTELTVHVLNLQFWFLKYSALFLYVVRKLFIRAVSCLFESWSRNSRVLKKKKLFWDTTTFP